MQNVFSLIGFKKLEIPKRHYIIYFWLLYFQKGNSIRQKYKPTHIVSI